MAKKQRVAEQRQEVATVVPAGPAAPSVQVTVSGPIQAKRTTIASPNLITMYSNGFQIAVGPLDVRLFVLETIPVSATEVIDKQIASIIMTPETLKLLASNVGMFVKIFEDNFGKIRDIPITQGPIQTINAPLQK